MSLQLLLTSLALGVGLAVDAFSVSLVNGLNEPAMRRGRMSCIAVVYALFQFAMPMIGWFCVHSIAKAFDGFMKAVPWIALILLLFIGGKMLIEGIRENRREGAAATGIVLSAGTLILQGISTSIDALSVGFAFAGYEGRTAFACALIIGGVTFLICIGGLAIGKKMGTRLSGKAGIIGGIILILIGIEIFVKGVFF